MKRLTNLLAITLLTSCATAFAQEQEETMTDGSAAERSEAIYASGYNKFRFGGYGEAVASFKDYGINRFYGGHLGNKKDHRNTISIPRFVAAFDYKFNSKWILGAEIEFEAGGVGTAYEIENSENGEYETEVEKGGEVALEQFHITRLIHPAFNIRAGHIIVPVGLTNSHHEPINFFGTYRPEGETTILPSTWHDNGLEIFGTFGRGYTTFSYQALVVSGLNANGFDRNTWIAGGKQGIFEEDNFTSPGYAFRLDYKGVPGLRAGASFYYCANTGANSDKLTEYPLHKIPVRIYTADAQYKNKYVTARTNFVWGNLSNAEYVSSVNTKLSNKSPYTRVVPVAKRAVSYAGEIGVNVSAFFNNPKVPVIYPFARYEYYNPQEEGEGMQVMELRNKVSMWTVGLNWFALPNLVVKADYMTRQIGTGKMFGTGPYNSENEFSIGIAYVGWFLSK
ncbi:hypothetical protein [uncultured Parabacteroides sp.]|uniref:hypothetical protein n=1 Tax=uncultured Parabacteroides sp. TaxID=512312 RepID=UPI0028038746|nr:hypothetical protein [uncultured Parabacteroides sp.]